MIISRLKHESGQQRKKNFKGTGGGPATKLHSDSVLEAVINIINYKAVCGLVPICDDDLENAEPSDPVESSLAKKVKRAVSKEIHSAMEPVNIGLRPKFPNPIFSAKGE
ncbi:unnamed protein product [Brassicogethes aeneus]|uniref:Uncharacterized protein n=1 Tax=Brassicogethes aeneus TaxID=1431903 RepID=A0A9P0FNF5_BRAAE|nr:unnamed protein product [Brassicogethes aeneus]